MERKVWNLALGAGVALFALSAWTAAEVGTQNNAAPTTGASVAANPGAQAASKPGRVLDTFDNNDWTPSYADGTTLKLSQVPGKTGQALRLDYDLKDTKQWVAIIKDIAIPDYSGKTIQFYMKGGGKTNNLEVKLVDSDGTNFGKKIPIQPTADWQLVRIKPTDFTYWWGGDSKLDTIKQVGFAVSNIEGGSGNVILDDLELTD